MELESLCSPAILYIGFSLTHIIIDTGREEYPQAIIKFFIMIVFTLILDMLCKRGLGTVSWLLVLLPFVSMTLITAILLSMFGINTYSSTVRINGPVTIPNIKDKIIDELSYEDTPYEPDDFSSGTPAEINHYNTSDSSDSTDATDSSDSSDANEKLD